MPTLRYVSLHLSCHSKAGLMFFVKLLTRGPRPNTTPLRSLGDGVLDERGCVKVRPTLQLVDHPDIFAAGDIIAVNEQKQLAKVTGHAGVIVANLLSIVGGKEPKTTYQTSFEAIVITDGKVRLILCFESGYHLSSFRMLPESWRSLSWRAMGLDVWR